MFTCVLYNTFLNISWVNTKEHKTLPERVGSKKAPFCELVFMLNHFQQNMPLSCGVLRSTGGMLQGHLVLDISIATSTEGNGTLGQETYIITRVYNPGPLHILMSQFTKSDATTLTSWSEKKERTF